MSEIARTHHEQLQEKNIPTNRQNHKRAMKEALEYTSKKIPMEKKEMLGALITREEIESSITTLQEGKAAGLDGIIHELWAELALMHNKEEEDDQTFDVVEALQIVYNDIQIHGMCKNTDFAEGWLCPIYKKGDKTDISNYRPITVLNTDYKIMTKVLVTRLGEVASYMIHPDQAGFMKGRRIKDQTELAQTAIEWCKITETNGIIVCLDQEKAYDKILHAFLWKSMRKNGIPKKFIDTIKYLYADAHTRVILNGEISESF